MTTSCKYSKRTPNTFRSAYKEAYALKFGIEGGAPPSTWISEDIGVNDETYLAIFNRCGCILDMSIYNVRWAQLHKDRATVPWRGHQVKEIWRVREHWVYPDIQDCVQELNDTTQDTWERSQEQIL